MLFGVVRRLREAAGSIINFSALASVFSRAATASDSSPTQRRELKVPFVQVAAQLPRDLDCFLQNFPDHAVKRQLAPVDVIADFPKRGVVTIGITTLMEKPDLQDQIFSKFEQKIVEIARAANGRPIVLGAAEARGWPVATILQQRLRYLHQIEAGVSLGRTNMTKMPHPRHEVGSFEMTYAKRDGFGFTHGTIPKGALVIGVDDIVEGGSSAVTMLKAAMVAKAEMTLNSLKIAADMKSAIFERIERHIDSDAFQFEFDSIIDDLEQVTGNARLANEIAAELRSERENIVGVATLYNLSDQGGAQKLENLGFQLFQGLEFKNTEMAALVIANNGFAYTRHCERDAAVQGRHFVRSARDLCL